MFERFTEQARHAIVLAHVEARMLGHDHIGAEHVLLGLVGEPDCGAAWILERLDVGAVRVREEVVALVGSQEGQASPRHVPFDQPATRVVEHAVREADSLGTRAVGTEHLLLGIVRETDGVGARVLQRLDLDEERIRAELERMMTGPGARLEAFIEEAEAFAQPGRPPADELPDVELLSDAELDLLIERLTVLRERAATHGRRLELQCELARSERARRHDGRSDV